MKGKLIAFASVLCIASLMASGAHAVKPVKPDKPGDTETELIVFTGDFAGEQEVENCCPNAGPFPEYQLNLTDGLVSTDGTVVYPAGIYDGYVFMNGYRIEKEKGYKVQFWTDGVAGAVPDHICIEVYGGVVDNNKKTKVLTVTFEDVAWNLMHDPDKNPMGFVSFVLTRSPL